MPLDEREQRILEEIEAQFYQEDPSFAHTVKNTTLRTMRGRRVRLAVVGFVIGAVVMLAFFTSNQLVALGGFVVMVGSAAWVVTAVRSGRGEGGAAESWLDGVRQRWRRSR